MLFFLARLTCINETAASLYWNIILFLFFHGGGLDELLATHTLLILCARGLTIFYFSQDFYAAFY